MLGYKVISLQDLQNPRNPLKLQQDLQLTRRSLQDYNFLGSSGTGLLAQGLWRLTRRSLQDVVHGVY